MFFLERCATGKCEVELMPANVWAEGDCSDAGSDERFDLEEGDKTDEPDIRFFTMRIIFFFFLPLALPLC